MLSAVTLDDNSIDLQSFDKQRYTISINGDTETSCILQQYSLRPKTIKFLYNISYFRQITPHTKQST